MSERAKTAYSGETQEALDAVGSRALRSGRGRGRPGGEESRARLIEAAGKLFARDGFHGVSTRSLANAANVNLAAITYHFGGKQALYHEVLRQLVDDTGPLVEPIIERLNTGVKEADGDERALGALAVWFIDRLFTGILGDEQVRWQMALMLREFHQPSEEFPMLLRERINPLHDAVARLVGAAKGQHPKAPETLLLTHALIGQCMVFGMARTVVWARLDWQGYTPERVKRIIATLTPAVLAMLGLAEIETQTKAVAKAAAEEDR